MSFRPAMIGWRGYAVATLVGGLVLGGAAWVVQGWRWDAKLARADAMHAAERDAQAQATVTAVEAAREEERRRTAAVEKVRDEAQGMAAAAAADAAGARAEHDWLRARANALARAAAGRDPTLAVGSPSGASAVDLLAHMLGRAIDRAEALAAIADSSRIAGLTCERAYDEVRGKR